MANYQPYRPQISRESFLTHARFLYLKWAIAAAIVAFVLYLAHDPFVPPNGGTPLGYALGIVSTLLIIWLLLLGARRRYYRTTASATRAWVSAHVYLGLCLIVPATLHTGFQFHWNIHTFAYVMMVLVILSGFWGAIIYLRNPRLMAASSEGASQREIIDKIVYLNQNALTLAVEIGDDKVHDAVVQAVERPAAGGRLFQQLFALGRRSGKGASQDAKNVVSAYFDTTSATQANRTITNLPEIETLEADDSRKVMQIRNLLDLLNQREIEESRLRRSIQLQGWMEIWLYLHVPLSFMMLGALIVHIITVFFYW